jgi:hypothetical protein
MQANCYSLYLLQSKNYSLPVKPSNLRMTKPWIFMRVYAFWKEPVSVGRGTEKQFQVYGSTYLPKPSLVYSNNLGKKTHFIMD